MDQVLTSAFVKDPTRYQIIIESRRKMTEEWLEKTLGQSVKVEVSA